MLICKYERRGNAVFVPHLDTLRAVTMGIRRIGAQVEYSEGFNPHMKIFFGQPLPVGTESLCEYFCVHVNEDPAQFVARLNESLPEGLRIVGAATIEKDPNVAKIMCYADYLVTMRTEEPNLIASEAFFTGKVCPIEYETKNEAVQKDVKNMIKSYKISHNKTIRLRLCCGNRNLRADRLMRYLQKTFGLGKYDILKTNMYDIEENDLDTIFFGRCL